MRRLAGEYEVLWVDGAFVRSLSQLDRRAWLDLFRKLRRGVGLTTVGPQLHVLRPLPVPPAGRVGRHVRLAVLRFQIRRALKRLGLDGLRVTWFSLPNVAALAGRLGERASVFFYQDRYHAFPHVDRTRLAADVRALAERCDVTMASSHALADELRELGADPVLVRHGVDLARFAGQPAVPDDIASLERPLVGYVGRIKDYLWLDMVRAVADRLDRGTVVLVGDTSIDLSALSHPRIELLGQRPAETMPAYIGSFDCCLIPFVVDGLTEAVNPIKLREYLAAGRPVVSTALPEVVPYGDVVSLADGPKEFADAVEQLLADPEADSDEARARRRARVADESWDAAADRVGQLLRRALV